MELKEEIIIATSQLDVWGFIINPNSFNKCFPHLFMECESLNIGSNIYFKEISSKKVDTAKISAITENKVLTYEYFKDINATPIHFAFNIEFIEFSLTKLKIDAKNFSSENEFNHSKQTWISMLIKVKEHLELTSK